MPSADFLGTAEPIFSFEYQMIFSKLGDNIIRFTEGITLPNSSNEIVEIFYKNKKKAIAGAHQHSQYSLKVKAFVDPNTAVEIWKWYRLVYPGKGVVGHPSSYKDQGQIMLTDGRYSPVATWTLTGAWPSKVEMGEAGEGSPQNIIMSLSLEVDDVDGPN